MYRSTAIRRKSCTLSVYPEVRSLSNVRRMLGFQACTVCSRFENSSTTDELYKNTNAHVERADVERFCLLVLSLFFFCEMFCSLNQRKLILFLKGSLCNKSLVRPGKKNHNCSVRNIQARKKKQNLSAPEGEREWVWRESAEYTWAGH